MSSAAGFSDELADLQLPVAPRRVRHEVRDGALVMLFSAAVSCGLAGGLVALSRILG